MPLRARQLIPAAWRLGQPPYILGRVNNLRNNAVGMVLLSEPILAGEVYRRLVDAGVNSIETSGSEVAEVRVGEVSVFVTPVPRPLAGDDVLQNIHPVFTEEGEMQSLGMHAAHLLVAAADFTGGAGILAVHRAHARVLQVVSGWNEVTGYAIEGSTVGASAFRGELADLSVDPVTLWSPVWAWSGEAGVTAYTYGLAGFGLPELQMVDAPLTAPEAYVQLFDAARELIDGAEIESLPGKLAVWVVDGLLPAWQLE